MNKFTAIVGSGWAIWVIGFGFSALLDLDPLAKFISVVIGSIVIGIGMILERRKKPLPKGQTTLHD